MTHKLKFLSQLLGYVSSTSIFHGLNHSRKKVIVNGEMTNTLENIIKRIYPPLNFGLLYFTFPLKFALDILWLPQSLVDIQYAQV
jgi:hypothetical protein